MRNRENERREVEERKGRRKRERRNVVPTRQGIYFPVIFTSFSLTLQYLRIPLF